MTELSLMQPADLQTIAQIEKEIFSMPWSKDGFAASLALPNTIYLTAREDGEIAGYCGLLQALDEADITNVAVREGYRRRGIARAMLQRLMEMGEKNGVKAFTLEVRRGNTAALALYEALGFQTAGVRKNFYEKPREDAVIMWKR